MTLYFDTNVYRFISATNETTAVAHILAVHGCDLIVSAENLCETFAIDTESIRTREFDVLSALPSRFETYPVTWHHALEVRNEIKRLRRRWLRPLASTGAIRGFLKSHKQKWLEAQSGTMPSPASYRAYRRDFETGVKRFPDTQKIIREALVVPQANASSEQSNASTGQLGDMDPELYWRAESLLAWHNAIEGRNPSSRDYYDWLNPYLRPGCFREESYWSFWRTEVSGQAMPLNKVSALANYYQLKRKITHGNATDQLHASQWFRADLFITCDRAFYEVLMDIACYHFPDKRKPLLADRSARSFAEQLANVLASPR